ncbi:kinase-like domain-containing protein [Gymnopilus junonius]|uniref:Kinase-like domain-containing protein n=1 Tax=Gymnopilus junonius TaxID=109634 RepID=A0A9P5NUN6_GYMJU|nr:kinase-like domain-containing protein [Gymnopilus junonius]
MEGSELRILFPFEPGGDFDLAERFRFWDSPTTIQWFRERGYTYTSRISDPDPRPTTPEPFGELYEAGYPYAYYDSSGDVPLGALDMSGKVVFAQDSGGRHVAMKLVRDGTDEYRVLRFLSQQSLETLKANCILPVLDLIPIDGFWFVVMPRWGSDIHLPWINNAGDVVDIIYSMLKALAFLHDHNISHGDLNMENVLVNHFSDYSLLEDNQFRADLRSKKMLSYAIFDFDFSTMLAPEADKKKCRLPYRRSWGTFNFTNDTTQGEFDFNPFVLDIGALGVRLCWAYQHMTGEIPLLAPLLDRMTTRDLQRRFTASEALGFFEDMYSQMTQTELARWVDSRGRGGLPYDQYDRWQRVPADFAKQWAIYKEPPIPWTTKVLRAICGIPWICHVVPWFRWFFFKLSSSPGRLYIYIVGLNLNRR